MPNETMQVARIHDYGGPEQIIIERVPRPEPKVFPLTQAGQAQALSQTGHGRGRIILRIA